VWLPEPLHRLHERGRLKSIMILLFIIAMLVIWAYGLLYLSR